MSNGLEFAKMAEIHTDVVKRTLFLMLSIKSNSTTIHKKNELIRFKH
jgi:hypothetical protein